MVFLKNKRKRREFSDQEKSLHKSKTQLHREIKKIRVFEAQKIVKQIKKSKEELQPGVCAPSVQLETLEHQLKALKELHLDEVVACALEMVQNKFVDENDERLKAQFHRFFKNKKIVALIDALKEDVAKFDKKDDIEPAIKQEGKDEDAPKKKRMKIKKLVGGRSASVPQSVFLTSLSGDCDEDVESHRTEEDDIAEFLGETKARKNRPGQRARKQKALDREAMENSKHSGSNVPKKNNFPRRGDKKKAHPVHAKPEHRKNTISAKPRVDEADLNSHLKQHKNSEPKNDSKVSAKKKNTKDVDMSHPSWVAKQAMKDKQKIKIDISSAKVNTKIVF